MGAFNEFDSENYLQFLAGNNDSEFRSSKDAQGSTPNNIFWDYTGVYGVNDVSDDFYIKTLTLDYDFFDNEFFELTVIDDQTIALFHPKSQTIYEFKGRGYIQYLKQSGNIKNRTDRQYFQKKRKRKSLQKENPRQNNRG